jgi:hypothetical protein
MRLPNYSGTMLTVFVVPFLHVFATDGFSSGLVRDALRPIRQAEFDARNSAPGCMADTRTYVLGLIKLWSEGPPIGLSVFWLAGMAGTGKTTIAKTACEQFAVADRLGASFFASHADKDRRDPCCILRTVAYQLAKKIPAMFRQVYKSVKEEYDISSRPLEEQLQKILVTPLLSAKNAIPDNTIIVIDALDECNKPESMELIRLLAYQLRAVNIKLLVASRNERVLEDMFKLLSPANLHLHDVEAVITAEDVRHYVRARLAEIAVKRQIKASSWPSAADIEALAQRTGPFFIYAATSVSFVGESRHNPVEQLQLLLESQTSGPGPFNVVDDLYIRILVQSTLDNGGNEDARLCQRIRSLMGTIMTVIEPVQASVLASLLELDKWAVQQDVSLLSSVLVSSKGSLQQPVRVLHASLPDFLLERCVDARFRIDASAFHARLTLRCLQILNSSLKNNICNITDPSLLNSEVDGLKEKLAEVAPDQLRYAARFWHVHLIEYLATMDDISLLKQNLDEFCSDHLLHWVELMSLLGQLSIVEYGLASLLVSLQVSPSVV